MVELNQILHIDALEGLKQLPDESIDMVLTSPPFWGMRDYGVPPTMWSDGSTCALGLEPRFNDYVAHLGEVFDGVRRVLKPSGTLWVNLGDSYVGSWGNYSPGGIKGVRRSRTEGMKRWDRPGAPNPTLRPPAANSQPAPRKSLCLIPSRFAIEMVARGWILRNDIVWHKPNHMPASVKDRFAASWEHLFFFTRDRRYHFDLDAVRLPHKGPIFIRPESARRERKSHQPRSGRRLPPYPGDPGYCHPKGKNPGDCWIIPTRPFRGAHFAVFPEELCERPILAGCPKKGVVLDPFMGAGTTAVVAKRLGRQFLGFELNRDYIAIAERRIAGAEEPVHSYRPSGSR